MRLTSWATAAAVLVLAASACSGEDRGAGVGAGAAPEGGEAQATTAPTAGPTAAEEEVLLVVHALQGRVAEDDGTFSVTLSGVDRRMSWFAAENGGITSTGQFAGAQLDELQTDDVTLQAVFVPGDPTYEAVLLEVDDASWDDETRILRLEATVPSNRLPRLSEMAPEPEARLPSAFSLVTVFFAYDDPELLPSPTTTSTTTTTTTTTPEPTTSAPDPTSPDEPPESPPATPRPTVAVPPTTGATPPPPAPPRTTIPSGTPDIRVTPQQLRIGPGGGSVDLTIRNIGTGVGSWSSGSDRGKGITVSPTSGFLFPGSRTRVTVSYDPSALSPSEPKDFRSRVEIFTPNGTVVIPLIVG